MFSLIITIISIALVAALALATIYYGGTTFNRGAAAATASKLLNQSQQILGADRLYRADHEGAMPNSMQDLIDGGYLKAVPTAQSSGKFDAAAATGTNVSTGEWAMMTTSTGRAYNVGGTSVSVDACKQVNMQSFGMDGVLKNVYSAFRTQCYGPDANSLTVLVVADSEFLASTPTIPYSPTVKTAAAVDPADWLVTPGDTSTGGGSTGGSGGGGSGTGGSGGGAPVTDPGVIETDDGAVWLKYSTHYFLQDSGRVEFDVVSNYENPLTVTGISGSIGQDGIYLFSNRFPGYASVVCTGSAFNYNCHISAYLDGGYGQDIGATGTLTVNTNYGTLTAPALVVDYDPTRHQDGVLRNY